MQAGPRSNGGDAELRDEMSRLHRWTLVAGGVLIVTDLLLIGLAVWWMRTHAHRTRRQKIVEALESARQAAIPGVGAVVEEAGKRYSEALSTVEHSLEEVASAAKRKLEESREPVEMIAAGAKLAGKGARKLL